MAERAQVAQVVEQWGSAPLDEPACDLCGSTERTQLATERFAGYVFGVVRCRRCGLVYSCPRPSLQLRQQLHDPQIRNALVEAGIIAPEHRISEGVPAIFSWESQRVHVPNYRRGLRLLERLGASGRLLDVGCAGGRFVQLAQEAGFQAMGCDIMPEQVKYGVEELGLDLRVGNLHDLHFGDDEFDVVTLWDVIEHVPSPLEVTREVARILRPGGHILIHTPNFRLRELLCRLGLAQDPYKYRLMSFEHIYHFTPRTLNRLILYKGGFGQVRYFVDTDDEAQGTRPRVRRFVARALWYATARTVNLHTPLFVIGVR